MAKINIKILGVEDITMNKYSWLTANNDAVNEDEPGLLKKEYIGKVLPVVKETYFDPLESVTKDIYIYDRDLYLKLQKNELNNTDFHGYFFPWMVKEELEIKWTLSEINDLFDDI